MGASVAVGAALEVGIAVGTVVAVAKLCVGSMVSVEGIAAADTQLDRRIIKSTDEIIRCMVMT
jgi:hypothetical protein